MIQTETAPAEKEETGKAPRIAHSNCLCCMTSKVAFCGHVRSGESAMGKPHIKCIVCWEMLKSHQCER